MRSLFVRENFILVDTCLHENLMSGNMKFFLKAITWNYPTWTHIGLNDQNKIHFGLRGNPLSDYN